MNIGWVGLGSIGTNMVRRALGAGHHVTVFARGKGLDEVKAAGAKVCPDYAALAADCDFLGLCVFSDTQLRSVRSIHHVGPLGNGQMLELASRPYLEKDVGTVAEIAAKAGIDISALSPTVDYFSMSNGRVESRL